MGIAECSCGDLTGDHPIVPFIYMVIQLFLGLVRDSFSGVFTLPESWYPANYSGNSERRFLEMLLNSVIVLLVSLVILLALSARALIRSQIPVPFFPEFCLQVIVHVCLFRYISH